MKHLPPSRQLGGSYRDLSDMQVPFRIQYYGGVVSGTSGTAKPEIVGEALESKATSLTIGFTGAAES